MSFTSPGRRYCPVSCQFRDHFARYAEHNARFHDSIASGEGARVEALAREHARLAARNLRYALRDRNGRDLIPGATLISQRRT